MKAHEIPSRAPGFWQTGRRGSHPEPRRHHFEGSPEIARARCVMSRQTIRNAMSPGRGQPPRFRRAALLGAAQARRRSTGGSWCALDRPARIAVARLSPPSPERPITTGP